MKTRITTTLMLIVLIFGSILSACGPSAEQVYLDKISDPIDTYNAKLDAVNAIEVPEDPTNAEWQAKITAALDELEQASKTLEGVTGGAPESCQALDGYIKEITKETATLASAYRGMFDALNMLSGQADEITTYTDNVQAALNAYAEKFTTFGVVVDVPNDPTDAAWQAESAAAIDEFEKAADDLGAIPQVPESLKKFDDELKNLAAKTKETTALSREMLDEFAAGNNDNALEKMNGLADGIEKFSEMLTQLNAEMDSFSPTNMEDTLADLNKKGEEVTASADKLFELVNKANAEIDALNK